MARELRGIVKGGVVVIEGDERLPDGTRVRIVVEEKAKEPKKEKPKAKKKSQRGKGEKESEKEG